MAVDIIARGLAANAASEASKAASKAESLGNAYTVQGSIAFASLPTPSKSNLGYIWNITDDFTTDSRFIEGAGKKFSAGTNVGVVVQNGSYYLDIFGAIVDYSDITPIQTTATLTVADWSDKVQTVSVSSVTADNAVQITPNGDPTAFATAGIYCSSQSAGSLTFICTTVPTEDITVNLLIQEAQTK